MANKLDAFNIDQFIGAYDDYARQYLFYCQINCNVPNVSIQRDHHFLVNSTSLPAETIAEAVTNWQGNQYKLATTSEYADFAVTFKLPRNSEFRREILRWKKAVHDPVTNRHGNPVDYMNAVINLQLLNNEGDPTLVYKLNKCWPGEVGAIELGYENKEIITFDVTWKYVYHTVEGV